MSDDVNKAKRAFNYLLGQHIRECLPPETADFVCDVVSGRMGGGSVKTATVETPAKIEPAKPAAAPAAKPKRVISPEGRAAIAAGKAAAKARREAAQ